MTDLLTRAQSVEEYSYFPGGVMIDGCPYSEALADLFDPTFLLEAALYFFGDTRTAQREISKSGADGGCGNAVLYYILNIFGVARE